jgi:TolB-like protein/Tfp pilus assembly protein PilF
MASLFEGYEYDIFISYRQKDNKGDRWVSEFVDALKTELESTFKEEISVYFDINPHDGLLETHDVDASLKDKLKCLIFIPIISRTYCDPKSFAWGHEFKAFVELASQDQFGLKVKLPTGNVANRVLPVRIYDLDTNDIKLCESILGSMLRSVDFIYKSSGVNRPLNPSDNPEKNLNKTYYRDQINKVANSIKEIITAIGQHIPQKEEVEVSKEVIKPIAVPKKNNRIKIIIATVVVLALIMIGYFLIPTFYKPKEQLEKSIAVLPFRNDSPNDSTTYFLNGVMEEILNNLQKISDFSRVLSRNSVEQFRNNTTKSMPEIAKKLNVNYIVEGSGQKYGNKFVLRVQLIAAGNEKHLWGKSYDREILQTSDIINIQSQIAQLIAAELKTIITPEEKQLINKIPTTNLIAYDFYQQGREEYTKYWINGNKASLQKAEVLYHKSLEYDSTFAQAYSGIARVYWDKHFWKDKEYISENFGDSVLILTDIALSFDKQLSEAYTLRGNYYSEVGKPEKTIEEFDKAIKLNPNDWMAYQEKGNFYSSTDLVNSINYLNKAASINRGAELPELLGGIGWAYFQAGFTDKAKQYFQDKLKLDGDSSSYYDGLFNDEFWLGNFNKSIEYGKKGYSIDSTNKDILEMLGKGYEWLGQYEESLKYYKKWFEILKTKGELNINGMAGIGYAYWQNGYKKEAEYYFNETIKNCSRIIELKRSWGQKLYSYYDLASAYASIGEKDKAYKNLRIFNQIQRVPLWMVTCMKTDPLFNSIRNEPEFQQIAKEIEAKYQAEHERVRKWLETQGML